MDITFAINRIKELQQQKERIESSLSYFQAGYEIEADKKYRVRLNAPKGGSSTEGSQESSHLVSVLLTEDIVKKQLNNELAALNHELNLLSPVIDAANDMVRNALNQNTLIAES